MSAVGYEQIISLLGLVAIWAIWYYLWKPLRADAFRETLFALRDDLFDLASDDVVSFSDPAYTQLRLLINGMIRFAHRVTFTTLILAKLRREDIPSGAFEEWLRNVKKLPQGPREKLCGIHARVFMAFTKQVVRGSALLWLYVGLRVAASAAWAIILFVIGGKTLASLSALRVRQRVGWEEENLAKRGARAIEARVLYEEQNRTKARGDHAYAQ
jgi:4-amino-4-deoxy-L-arabinose transferase-like glycosyltransferase